MFHRFVWSILASSRGTLSLQPSIDTDKNHQHLPITDQQFGNALNSMNHSFIISTNPFFYLEALTKVWRIIEQTKETFQKSFSWKYAIFVFIFDSCITSFLCYYYFFKVLLNWWKEFMLFVRSSDSPNVFLTWPFYPLITCHLYSIRCFSTLG